MPEPQEPAELMKLPVTTLVDNIEGGPQAEIAMMEAKHRIWRDKAILLSAIGGTLAVLTVTLVLVCSGHAEAWGVISTLVAGWGGWVTGKTKEG